MGKQQYLRNRRLRVFGGPNGSGKSTILNQIKSKYDLGYYINADIIEEQLREVQHINLLDFGISEFKQPEFEKLLKTHSIVKKANNDGYLIDLYTENDKIINPDRNSHSYEAAFIADILRIKLLDQGRKFAFETVMSHRSKVDFFKKCIRATNPH